ncbi:molybdopterin molybdotransferase MoeA [Roseomonas frigidaquae]|uniref:Molybdopterin molybdenumtransferase n=1 Tax=Falsiroseomonas frigidaquae TaxID=487318 RepID=A0ABX1ETA1_9PROT|nr:molybdopterin molybdotransferase MoeA [Falsiroseomonas frigidaquae]NKE43802.1 molybdopterin molybdotransferase MoeA [Falsiroseomonas frigidaquae]
MPDGSLMNTRPDAARAPSCCDEEAGLMPPAEARRRLLADAVPVEGLPVEGQETLALADALGRILAEAPAATRDLPPFDQSAMDGYGLAEADLAPAAAPALGRTITAGADPGPAIAAGETVRLLTGAALPEGVAAVVMEEHVALRAGQVLPRRALRPGDNIRRRGEDVACGEILVAPGTRLDARHLALLAAAGIAQVAVRPRLRVAVLSNGNELGGAIHDSNRPMLLALLARPEVACTDLGVLPDDRAAIAAALRDAARDHDLILASGGVCGSDADHLPGAIRDAGGWVRTLRLALKPGKPLAHGRIGRAACLCLPGNPLAALVSMLLLGRPLVARLAGAPDLPMVPQAAVAGEGFARKPGRAEYAPARIVGHDAAGLPILVREGSGGSARLKPLSRADGLLCLPASCTSVAAGDAVQFHPFATPLGL